MQMQCYYADMEEHKRNSPGFCSFVLLRGLGFFLFGVILFG